MTNALREISAFQQTRPTPRERENVIVSDVFTNRRFVVPPLSSKWAAMLADKLNELVALPIGWDGYTGQPVSFHTALFVAGMLERLSQNNVPAPSLVPGSDGSLQVEWHRNNYDVELDVLAPQNVVATRLNRQTGKEQEIELQSDFSDIVEWIAALADDAVMP